MNDDLDPSAAYDEPADLEELRRRFRYDPNTGEFTRRVATARNPAGSVVGYRRSRGHVVIFCAKRRFMSHRMAWAFAYGAWPVGEIDHINGDPADHRISNLREVTHAVNMQNQRRARSDNASGLIGVHRRKSGGYSAQIGVDGKRRVLGNFATPEAAHAAYIAAKRALHEGNTL